MNDGALPHHQDPPLLQLKHRLIEAKQESFNRFSDIANEILTAMHQCTDLADKQRLEALYFTALHASKREAREIEELNDKPTFGLHAVG